MEGDWQAREFGENVSDFATQFFWSEIGVRERAEVCRAGLAPARTFICFNGRIDNWWHFRLRFVIRYELMSLLFNKMCGMAVRMASTY